MCDSSIRTGKGRLPAALALIALILGLVLSSAQAVGTLSDDQAYISRLSIVQTDGSLPFDGDSNAGNDELPNNLIVRSFDSIHYTLTAVMAPYDLEETYDKARIYFEFDLPYTEQEAVFDTSELAWLQNLTLTTDGSGQHLTGYYDQLAQGAAPNVIPGERTFNVTVNVLAMQNGVEVRPTFSAWLEGNRNDGTDGKCPDHDRVEKVVVEPQIVTVSARPMFNICTCGSLTAPSNYNRRPIMCDYTTGNDLALNKQFGTVEGLGTQIGIAVQMVAPDASKGLKGCELPDVTKPITFDILLDPTVTVTENNKNVTHRIADRYMPLVWTWYGNSAQSGIPSIDGRTHIISLDSRVNAILPASAGLYVQGATSPIDSVRQIARESQCYDDGDWRVTQDGNRITVTITDFNVDYTRFPIRSANTMPLTNAALIRKKGKFSVGVVNVIQPLKAIRDADGNPIADGNGQSLFDLYPNDKLILNMNYKDVNMELTSASGSALAPGAINTNDNQTVIVDDQKTIACTYERSIGGQLYGQVHYCDELYTGNSGVNSVTDIRSEDCWYSNCRDWTTLGARISICARQFYQANGVQDNRMVALNHLVKIDDEGLTFNGSEKMDTGSTSYTQFGFTQVKTLYAAKPDGTGWADDQEMLAAKEEDLLYYDSIAALETAHLNSTQEKNRCVGALLELRGLQTDPYKTNQIYEYIGATVRSADVAGKVFMICESVNGWTVKDLKPAHPAVSDDELYQYVQTRAGLVGSLPTRSLKTYATEPTYIKATYDDSGFLGGQDGLTGDSLYVIGYKANVAVDIINQTEVNHTYDYDLSKGQRVADYMITPGVQLGNERLDGNGKASVLINTVTITDTLPAGLAYIDGSAYYGGTYTAGEPGERGDVTGGVPVTPLVAQNAAGDTVLTWRIPNVTVTENGHDMLPIRFSVQLGVIGDEKNDLKNGEMRENIVTISAPEDRRAATTISGNKALVSLHVLKTMASSVAKIVDDECYEVNQPIGFMTYNSNMDLTTRDVLFMDTMPANGINGSVLHSAYVLSEWTLYLKNDDSSTVYLTNPQEFTLFYTIDPTAARQTSVNYRGATQAESLQSLRAAGWEELALPPTAGRALSTDVMNGKPVTAWALVGPLKGEESLHVHISLSAQSVADVRGGDTMVNMVSENLSQNIDQTRIASRELSGVAWEDRNKNGVLEQGEKLLPGITVTVVDGAGAPLVDLAGRPCVATTDQNGAYGFTHLPEGAFRIVFTSGETDISSYAATLLRATDAAPSAISLAEGVYSTQKLARTVIDPVLMPALNELSTHEVNYRYRLPYQNCGLILLSTAPTKPTTPTLPPKTGDAAEPWLWMELMALSLIGCAALLAYRCRVKRS